MFCFVRPNAGRMEAKRCHFVSDERHQSFGNCLELDLSIGPILAVDRPIGIEDASNECPRSHCKFWCQTLQFLQADWHSP